MDNNGKPLEEGERDEEGNGLEWLLQKEKSEVIIPMDTNVSIQRQEHMDVDNICSKTFTRERVFEAASQGNVALLEGLLKYLNIKGKRLTSPEFTDELNGKTALLKALLNLKDGKNDTVEVFLAIAERTNDLKDLINASYKDPFYKGQSALHVAIERRSFNHVKMLVENGADVQAKANGTFFQCNTGLGFYFGELPLSLAACTNQPEIVSYLMENPHRRADVTDQDSRGNTVLHTLVVIADDTTDNTDMIAGMYDQILIQHFKPETKTVQLEAIENNQGLTPLKLAARLGKIGLFRHILHREFTDERMRSLSRKFTEWVYGPVRSSLFDTSSIDTDQRNSVLEIVIFGNDIPNQPEMLQIEPLRSLLQEKWDRFASKLFLMNFLFYLAYLSIFTTVAFYRKEGQPPFPIEHVPLDYFRACGEFVSLFGAVWFFYKAIVIFKRNPPYLKSLSLDGFSDIIFFLQATLLLLCAVLYITGCRQYVGFLVVSLALAWINVLYYSRGSRHMGIYSVMMQRMILHDLLHFLCVYGVFLFGFSAAVVTLIDDSPPDSDDPANGTGARGRSFETEPFTCKKPTYNDIRFTTLELFKFTIGMGDLEFTDHVQSKEVFYILLILYIVLTYILLLNMLIALMGNTVERISKDNENIWNLQRAFTILDLERTLPRCLMRKLRSGSSNMLCFTAEDKRFFRVLETNWKKWRSDLGYIQEEDPGDTMLKSQSNSQPQGGLWRINPLLDRIRVRGHPQVQLP
ncbi:transient receptor potential cation channel subfamily V member 1-like [Takifugu rubripes]|uniref:transient receptor potential cation channel subfamily V member 1-like n=1 Tax=Takifugu rubripes TaxID=31033 RepID=UPI0011460623|nr:transient receptor potential cation channel subfamily V member 1-like [Takifugu rubripes]